MAKTRIVSKRQEMRARAIVQRAQDQERARDVAAKRELIGRCFKYRNRFSDGEAWWLYAVVTGVDEHGRLTAMQFQHNSMNAITLEADAYGGLLPNGGWSPATAEEFRAAAVEVGNAFLERLSSAMKVAAVDPVLPSSRRLTTREKGSSR